MNNFVVTFSEEFAQKSVCENSRHNKIILQVCCFLGGFLVKNDLQSCPCKCESTAYKKKPLKHSKHIFVILLKLILRSQCEFNL